MSKDPMLAAIAALVGSRSERYHRQQDEKTEFDRKLQSEDAHDRRQREADDARAKRAMEALVYQQNNENIYGEPHPFTMPDGSVVMARTNRRTGREERAYLNGDETGTPELPTPAKFELPEDLQALPTGGFTGMSGNTMGRPRNDATLSGMTAMKTTPSRPASTLTGGDDKAAAAMAALVGGQPPRRQPLGPPPGRQTRPPADPLARRTPRPVMLDGQAAMVSFDGHGTAFDADGQVIGAARIKPYVPPITGTASAAEQSRERRDSVNEVRAAQARADAVGRDMRRVLGARPKPSQFADPLTRMPDTASMNTAMTDWRADSTEAASSLDAARAELERVGGGRGRAGAGTPPPKPPINVMDRAAWAVKNPPRKGEAFDAYQRRYDAYAATLNRKP